MRTAYVGTRPVASERQLERIQATVNSTGGHSEHLPNGDQPTDGYMVSLRDCERTVPLSGFTYTWLKRYVIDHADTLRLPGYYLGLWVDGWGEPNAQRTVYADVSERIHWEHDARTVGRVRGQLAIYAVAAAAVITL